MGPYSHKCQARMHVAARATAFMHDARISEQEESGFSCCDPFVYRDDAKSSN